VRVASKATEPLAFISCDEEPDHGRISVPLRSLTQYSATLAGMTAFISGLLKLGSPRSSAAGVLPLGTIKGRHGPRQISVGLAAGRLMLQVGRQQESVVRVLRWAPAGLTIDMTHIQRLANRKEPVQRSRKAYRPDRTKQQEQSRMTEARNKAILREAKKRRAETRESWTTIATAIAATDLSKTGDRRPVSATTVRRIITEMVRRERFSLNGQRTQVAGIARQSGHEGRECGPPHLSGTILKH
jgi:hypothetical protein